MIIAKIQHQLGILHWTKRRLIIRTNHHQDTSTRIRAGRKRSYLESWTDRQRRGFISGMDASQPWQGWQEAQPLPASTRLCAGPSQSYQRLAYMGHWQSELLQHNGQGQLRMITPIQHASVLPWIYRPSIQWSSHPSTYHHYRQHSLPSQSCINHTFRTYDPISTVEDSHRDNYRFYPNQKLCVGPDASQTLSPHISGYREGQINQQIHLGPESHSKSKGVSRDIIVIDLTESLPSSTRSSPQILLGEFETDNYNTERRGLRGAGVALSCSGTLSNNLESKLITDYSSALESDMKVTFSETQSRFPNNTNHSPPGIGFAENPTKMGPEVSHLTAKDLHVTPKQQTLQIPHTYTEIPGGCQETPHTRMRRLQESDFSTPEYEHAEIDDFSECITARKKPENSKSRRLSSPNVKTSLAGNIESFKQDDETRAPGISGIEIPDANPVTLHPRTRYKSSIDSSFHEVNVLKFERRPQLERSVKHKSACRLEPIHQSGSMTSGLTSSKCDRETYEMLESDVRGEPTVPETPHLRKSIVVTNNSKRMATLEGARIGGEGAPDRYEGNDDLIMWTNSPKPIRTEVAQTLVHSGASTKKAARTPVSTTDRFDYCRFYEMSKSAYFTAQPFDSSLDSIFPGPTLYPFADIAAHISLYEFVLNACNEQEPDELRTLGRLAKAAWLGMKFATTQAVGGDTLFEFYLSILSHVWNSLVSRMNSKLPQEKAGRILKAHMPLEIQSYNESTFMFEMQARLGEAGSRMQQKETLVAMIGKVDGWGMKWWMRVHAVLNEEAETLREWKVHVLWTKELLEATLRLAELASKAFIGVEQVWTRIIRIAEYEERCVKKIVIFNERYIGVVIKEIQSRIA